MDADTQLIELLKNVPNAYHSSLN